MTLNNDRKQVRIYLDLSTLDQCQRQQAVFGMNLSDTVQIALNQYFAQQTEAPHSHESSQ